MPFDPIVPMEPQLSDALPQGAQWLAQVKWDGVRILAYYDGTSVELRNRRGRDRTVQYPEFRDVPAYCRAHSLILDGEAVALGDSGKPSFHEVMRRDALREPRQVEAVRRRVPVYYMVFDILYADGIWLLDWPLEDRLEKLADILMPGGHVQLVSSHPEADALFAAVCTQGMEGIVVKQRGSRYVPGTHHPAWRKIKNYRSLTAVVGGFTVDDAGVANALLLGLFGTDEQLVYIGRAGTGRLSRREWRSLTDRLMDLRIRECPFVRRPERSGGAIWVAPHVTVRVQYIEWPAGHLLRQPSIQSVTTTPAHLCRVRGQEPND